MTLAIAIMGAVTGLISLVLNLRSAYLDRAKVSIALNPLVRPDGSADLIAIVTNDGRRPATVGPAGLYWDVAGELPHRPAGEVLFNDPWSRDLVGAYATATYVWNVPANPYVHLDCPVRAFADVGKRRVSGTALPIYRIMRDMGFSVDTATQPALTRPLDSPPVAHPLPMWWQFKRRRDAAKRRPRVPLSALPEAVSALKERLEREGRLGPSPTKGDKQS